MASVVVGDYTYTYTEGSGEASVEVTDTSKSSYGAIQSPITIDGNDYYVTDMHNCFSGCTSLTQAPEIPDSVTNMSHCFFICTALTQAPSIPNSVLYMDNCFNVCTSLIQAPEIPDSVMEMSHCFSGCTSLIQAPDIPNSVMSMTSCFSGCTSLIQAPEISDSVIDMASCFSGCTSLTQAPEIPDSVTNMGSCFYGCTALTDYIIVHNKPSSYSNAFTNAGNLKVITIGTDNTVYTTWSNIVNDFSNVTMASDSDITDRQFHLGDYQYTYNSLYSLGIQVIDKTKSSYSEIITPVYILNNSINVTSMYRCFLDCTALTQAPEIPNSIIDMEGCFSGCTSLIQAPEIPNLVFYMKGCFGLCTSLTQAPEIPSSVQQIDYCFYDCTSLRGNIYVTANFIDSYTCCFDNTIQPIYLINNTSPRKSSITSRLRNVASEYSNVFFEADNITPPSIILKNLRVTDDEETESSLDGTWVYTNAISTFYNTGQLPEGWSVSMNTNEVAFLVDSLDVTSSLTFHKEGPSQSEGNKYTTDVWYNTTDLSQHEIKFGIKLHVYDENSTYLYDNIYLSAPTILPSSMPLVSYRAGGDGIAFGQSSTQAGFYCNMEAHFKDKSNIIRELFNLFYPIGSYYETHLPYTINGHSYDNNNLTSTELVLCGSTWFDPRVVWGGTWVLETEGLVHISAGTNYAVNGAETDTQDGGSPYIQAHTHAYTNPSVSGGAHVHTLNQRNAGTSGGRATNNVTYGASGYDYQTAKAVVSSGSHSHTVSGGGVGAVNGLPAGQTTGDAGNMPPYIIVYRWHRTA